MEEKYDIFLSYRRDTGFQTAKILYEMLKSRGYRVFMDVESLRTGTFNKKLYSVIERCTDFILILSKDYLDRCVNEDDWIRNEVSHAIKLNKNIVPVQTKDFTEPTVELPPDVKDIVNYNRIMPTEQLFNEAVEKMCGEFIKSAPKTGVIREKGKKNTVNLKPKTRKISRKIFLFSVIMSVLSLIASFIVISSKTLMPSDRQDLIIISIIIFTVFVIAALISGIYGLKLSRKTFLFSVILSVLSFISSFMISSLRLVGGSLRPSVRRDLPIVLFIAFIVFGISALISGICCLIKKISSRISPLVSEESDISIDMMTMSPHELVQKLMLLPNTNLISGTLSNSFDYAGYSEYFKRDNYRLVRELRNVVIASHTGERIDYVCWMPDNTYSFLSLKRGMKTESISEVLSEQGFFFKKRIETGDNSCKIVFGNDMFNAVLKVNGTKSGKVECVEIIRTDN